MNDPILCEANRFASRAVYQLRGRGFSLGLAEDAVDLAIVALWESLQRTGFETPRNVKAWLYHRSSLEALNLKRNGRRFVSLDALASSGNLTIEALAVCGLADADRDNPERHLSEEEVNPEVEFEQQTAIFNALPTKIREVFEQDQERQRAGIPATPAERQRLRRARACATRLTHRGGLGRPAAHNEPPLCARERRRR